MPNMKMACKFYQENQVANKICGKYIYVTMPRLVSHSKNLETLGHVECKREEKESIT